MQSQDQEKSVIQSFPFPFPKGPDSQGVTDLKGFVHTTDVPNLSSPDDTFRFFRYVRPLDPNNWDDEKGIFNFGPVGGVTFYFQWRPKALEADMSFSICCMTPEVKENGETVLKDNFCKKIGRDKAYERFVSPRVEGVTETITPKTRFLLCNIDTDQSMVENVYDALVYSRTMDENDYFGCYFGSYRKPGEHRVIDAKEAVLLRTLENWIATYYWVDPTTGYNPHINPDTGLPYTAKELTKLDQQVLAAAEGGA